MDDDGGPDEENKQPKYGLASSAIGIAHAIRIAQRRSDGKSGFHLHTSHLSDPMRLSRSMIAAALAYLMALSMCKSVR